MLIFIPQSGNINSGKVTLTRYIVFRANATPSYDLVRHL